MAVTHQRLWELEWLHAQQIVERTSRDIGAELGCSVSSVNLAIQRFQARRGPLEGEVRPGGRTDRGAAQGLGRGRTGRDDRGTARHHGEERATNRPSPRLGEAPSRPTDRTRPSPSTTAITGDRAAPSPGGPAVDPVLLDALASAVDAGENVEEAALRLGLPRHRAAFLYRTATGRTVAATRADARERRLSELAATFDAGASLEEMSALVGVTPASVKRMLAVTGRRPRARDAR